MEKGFPLRPHQVYRKNGHQKAVREIGYLPPVGYQFRQHAAVERRHKRTDQRPTPCNIRIWKGARGRGIRRSLDVLSHNHRDGTCLYLNPIHFPEQSECRKWKGSIRGIPYQLPCMGKQISRAMANYFHFIWKSMSQFFPLEVCSPRRCLEYRHTFRTMRSSSTSVCSHEVSVRKGCIAA